MNTKFIDDANFNLVEYFEFLDYKIQNILLREQNDNLTFDILDTKKSIKNKIIALKERQRQIKIGEIWQEVLGNYNGCINLKNGSASGLDIVSHTKKFIIELKNRTNTDNSSSKKSNFDKLANYKKKYPSYTCIYATINAPSHIKTLNINNKTIIHNGVEIEHYSGYKFLNFILGDYTEMIIHFVKNTIDKYT